MRLRRKPKGFSLCDETRNEGIADADAARISQGYAERQQREELRGHPLVGKHPVRPVAEDENPREALYLLRADYSALLLEKEDVEVERDCLRVALHLMAREKDALEQQLTPDATVPMPRVRSLPAPGGGS